MRKKIKLFTMKSQPRKRAIKKIRDKTSKSFRYLISKLSLLIENLSQLNILTKTESLRNCIKRCHSTVCCQLRNEFRAEGIYIDR